MRLKLSIEDFPSPPELRGFLGARNGLNHTIATAILTDGTGEGNVEIQDKTYQNSSIFPQLRQKIV